MRFPRSCRKNLHTRDLHYAMFDDWHCCVFIRMLGMIAAQRISATSAGSIHRLDPIHLADGPPPG